MRFSVSELYDRLTREGILFCFCGSASQSIVEGIGETLLQRIRLEGTDGSVVGKVFQVFVEQMQNVVSYSAEKIGSEDDEAGELRVGIVVVGRDDSHFFVRCGNFVENEKTEALRTRLENLRNMSKEQLKTYYREERRKADSRESGKGAGLGFIDMARKASKPIEFDIAPVDEERSFFTLTAII